MTKITHCTRAHPIPDRHGTLPVVHTETRIPYSTEASASRPDPLRRKRGKSPSSLSLGTDREQPTRARPLTRACLTRNFVLLTPALARAREHEPRFMRESGRDERCVGLYNARAIRGMRVNHGDERLLLLLRSFFRPHRDDKAASEAERLFPTSCSEAAALWVYN